MKQRGAEGGDLLKRWERGGGIGWSGESPSGICWMFVKARGDI